jgi:hypothetical protein
VISSRFGRFSSTGGAGLSGGTDPAPMQRRPAIKIAVREFRLRTFIVGAIIIVVIPGSGLNHV